MTPDMSPREMNNYRDPPNYCVNNGEETADWVTYCLKLNQYCVLLNLPIALGFVFIIRWWGSYSCSCTCAVCQGSQKWWRWQWWLTYQIRWRHGYREWGGSFKAGHPSTCAGLACSSTPLSFCRRDIYLDFRSRLICKLLPCLYSFVSYTFIFVSYNVINTFYLLWSLLNRL